MAVLGEIGFQKKLYGHTVYIGIPEKFYIWWIDLKMAISK